MDFKTRFKQFSVTIILILLLAGQSFGGIYLPDFGGGDTIVQEGNMLVINSPDGSVVRVVVLVNGEVMMDAPLATNSGAIDITNVQHRTFTVYAELSTGEILVQRFIN